MKMPKIPQKYHAIDEEQGNHEIHESIIQAQPIEPSSGPTLDMTIINALTPQPTRKAFITRVYSILWLQLLVTSIFIGCCNQIQPLQTFMMSSVGITLMWISIVLLLVLTCALHCLRERLKSCPCSGIYLTIFTIITTYILGSVGIVYKLSTLLLAGISTLGIFSGLSLYSVQTKYDYTDKGGYLIALLLGFIMFGFFVSFTHYQVSSIVYSSIGSIIFSFYIVYDTQLIVGGDHRKIMFHTDDYVLAAVSLYLDIINLFLMLLDLLNGGRN